MTFKPQTVPHIIPDINDEDWRNENHIQIRRVMIREIFKLLSERVLLKIPRMSNGQRICNIYKRLPKVTQKIELQIYRNASSFEEYTSTMDRNRLLNHLKSHTRDNRWISSKAVAA
jgi:hypothetical protein